MLKSQHILSSNFPIPLSKSHLHRHNQSSLSPPPLHFTHRPLRPSRLRFAGASASATETTAGATSTTKTASPSQQQQQQQEGPVELLPPSTPVFATDDDPSTLQIATSVLLTGAISVFLFRSLRRRARRAKELKFRSSGVKKSLKDEALDSLKAMGSSSVDTKSPPSPAQALLGAISAGVIALILYKFTTTIEAALNRQFISDNYSVRQITITVRTIINGLCYLATFVFGINSVGLFLYAGQLAINSIMEGPEDEATKTLGEGQLGSKDSTVGSPTNTSDTSKENQTSDDPQ